MADFHRKLRDLFDDDWIPTEPPRWNGTVERVLYAHPDTIELTRAAFQSTAKRGLECGLFWYGAMSQTRSTVLSIVVPRQICKKGQYELPDGAIDEVSDATLLRGWFNLAQVHTHPSTWVSHSPYDDRYANSRRALSLVYPTYGRVRPQWPGSVGIHEYLDGHWQRLADEKVPMRIVFDASCPVPETLDLRPRHGR